MRLTSSAVPDGRARIDQSTLDVRDLGAMAHFWAAALDHRIDANDGYAHLWPPPGPGPGAR